MGVQGIVVLSLFQSGTIMDLARRSLLNMKQNLKKSATKNSLKEVDSNALFKLILLCSVNVYC